jgi:hypothetical protein
MQVAKTVMISASTAALRIDAKSSYRIDAKPPYRIDAIGKKAG